MEYKSRSGILLMLDMLAISVSFVIALKIRYEILVHNLGSRLIISTYIVFFAYAMLLYVILFVIKEKPKIERLSYREIVIITLEHQVTFIAVYMIFFFMTHNADVISRVVVTLFFGGNVIGVSAFRCLYHRYCSQRTNAEIKLNEERKRVLNDLGIPSRDADEQTVRHVYIIGAKSIGLYGGYEAFVMNLLEQHEKYQNIKYHVACKANGNGCMEISKVQGIQSINDVEFSFHNAHCFMINVPEWAGSAQAVYYDVEALKWCCSHIEINHIPKPVVYILASRIGPFAGRYVKRIHKAGGVVFQNPDGHEDWRGRWNYIIRRYWKFSEGLMVRNADLVICDNRHIEEYIRDEYSHYSPETTFIPYGTHLSKPELRDGDPKYVNWLRAHDLRDGQYYISVGRFVPENNFETMISEFMHSNTGCDLAIISNDNPGYYRELLQKLGFDRDKRIKFVGTVYDMELLMKIRERARGYIHGHSVGGTNPSLLEAMAGTKINLVYDVPFNREVSEDSALYFSKDAGSLGGLIERTDAMGEAEREAYGQKAVRRIQENYTWEMVAERYREVFCGSGIPE